MCEKINLHRAGPKVNSNQFIYIQFYKVRGGSKGRTNDGITDGIASQSVRFGQSHSVHETKRIIYKQMNSNRINVPIDNPVHT